MFHPTFHCLVCFPPGGLAAEVARWLRIMQEYIQGFPPRWTP